MNTTAALDTPRSIPEIDQELAVIIRLRLQGVATGIEVVRMHELIKRRTAMLLPALLRNYSHERRNRRQQSP